MAQPPLEKLFERAIAQPELHDEFLRLLLATEVFVATETRMPGGAVVPAGTTVLVRSFVRTDGVTCIPFYTSRESFLRANPEDNHCILMQVRDLFESRLDAYFYFNPTSSFEYQFSPAEIAELLTWSTTH